VRYRIEYTTETKGHFQALSARQRSILLDAVEVQLASQPAVQTRNRKPMRPNPLATWELRVGNLRVYYDVIDKAHPTVVVRAVGVKEREQVRIGGRQVGDEILQDDEDAGRD